jgi:LacI family transcriptional regulator
MKFMRDLKHILLLLTWYDYRLHRGVAEVAREAGWHLICPKSVEESRRILAGWQGDGCVAVYDHPRTLHDLHTRRIPTVELGLTPLDFPVPRVVTDNQAIGRLAARHFLDHGYREVFAAHPMGIPIFEQRLAAVTDHMQAAGGAVHMMEPVGSSWSHIIEQLESIATRRSQRLEELSIGIFAYEDYSAATLISVCLEHGLQVPQNVAVLGVDNDDLINAGLALGLSTIDTDLEGLGRAGARLLKRMLDDPAGDYSQELQYHPPKGIEARQSTDAYAVGSPMVAAALHWIAHHVIEGIQAIDVAKAMKISQQGLQKAFATHHVRTPGQEIRHQRLQVAEYELTQTRDTLAQIAERCGYETVDTLISNFRDAHKITPGQYRKQRIAASDAYRRTKS